MPQEPAGQTRESADGVSYLVRRAPGKPELAGLWDGPIWSGAEALEVSHFCFETVSRHPRTRAKLLYDAENLYIHFRVEDRHVRAVCTHAQDPVYRDSCVEAFIEPRPGGGYFNFEVNCGGTMLLQWGANHGRRPVDVAWMERITTYHSLPKTVDPPIEGPVVWSIEYAVPISLLEAHSGPLGDLAGQVWHANFYKCGGDPTYRHYAAWAPLTTDRFHTPEEFGAITFE